MLRAVDVRHYESRSGVFTSPDVDDADFTLKHQRFDDGVEITTAVMTLTTRNVAGFLPVAGSIRQERLLTTTARRRYS